MVPRTTKGRGFKGAAAYYLHDKGKDTAERVRFTHTLNTVSNDPHRAINEMCWTANHALHLKTEAGSRTSGNKLQKPVFAFSLSWHEEDRPTDQHMIEAATSALKFLKMDDYQAVMVAHSDTKHPHLHVIVNRVHPETGIAHKLSCDHNRFSDWAREYQRERGQEWCPQREINHAAREKAKREKGQGKRKSAFVKDHEGQKRDTKPAYDRRAAAIRARKQKELDQAVALDARKTDKELYRAPDILPLHDPVQAAKAFLAQRTEEGGYKKQKQIALNKAASLDARKKDKELYRADEIAPPHDQGKAAAAFKDQQMQDAKRQKFEDWALKAKLAIHEKHLAQRDKDSQVISKRLQDVEDRIEQQYGQSRRDIQARLAVLKSREDQGGSVSRFIALMRGHNQEKKDLEKTLATIEQRSAEIRKPVEQQNDYDLNRSARERAADFEKLDQHIARQQNYEIPKEQSRAPEKDRTRGGPEPMGLDR